MSTWKKKVQKVGNAQAILIPKAGFDELGWDPNEIVDILIKPGIMAVRGTGQLAQMMTGHLPAEPDGSRHAPGRPSMKDVFGRRGPRFHRPNSLAAVYQQAKDDEIAAEDDLEIVDET